jgi:hypothetical protein
VAADAANLNVPDNGGRDKEWPRSQKNCFSISSVVGQGLSNPRFREFGGSGEAQDYVSAVAEIHELFRIREWGNPG